MHYLDEDSTRDVVVDTRPSGSDDQIHKTGGMWRTYSLDSLCDSYTYSDSLSARESDFHDMIVIESDESNVDNGRTVHELRKDLSNRDLEDAIRMAERRRLMVEMTNSEANDRIQRMYHGSPRFIGSDEGDGSHSQSPDEDVSRAYILKCRIASVQQKASSTMRNSFERVDGNMIRRVPLCERMKRAALVLHREWKLLRTELRREKIKRKKHQTEVPKRRRESYA